MGRPNVTATPLMLTQKCKQCTTCEFVRQLSADPISITHVARQRYVSSSKRKYVTDELGTGKPPGE